MPLVTDGVPPLPAIPPTSAEVINDGVGDHRGAMPDAPTDGTDSEGTGVIDTLSVPMPVMGLTA